LRRRAQSGALTQDSGQVLPAADLPTRILLVHNRYKLGGGEDSTFESERDLLARMGHEVHTLEFRNEDTDALTNWRIAADAVWSSPAAAKVADNIRAFSPQIVHFHNTFLRVSPAAYWACKRLGVPVVQTLQNYRLLCVNALFLRDGKPCEDCLGRAVPWPGLIHRCYHGSLRDSGLVASINLTHRLLGTYVNKVDAFIALTQFGKRKFVEGGLPESKIHVKPNFVPDSGVGSHDGGYCLFAGRLSPEKGIDTLIDAWNRLPSGIPLKVAGTGPLESLFRQPRAGVEYLGARSREGVLGLMRNATVAILPSKWYEGFPVSMVEAFSVGLPVIASRLGAMEEMLLGENSGWLFNPGDPDDLARTVRRAWERPAETVRKGKHARLDFERRLNPETNYQILKEIYAAAINASGDHRAVSP
jgi:glycosyltransferase involved in cell wall biosynthesis